jgi:hypothetical protein
MFLEINWRLVLQLTMLSPRRHQTYVEGRTLSFSLTVYIKLIKLLLPISIALRIYLLTIFIHYVLRYRAVIAQSV